MMYYPCSENKGADQIRGYCEADPAPLFSVSFLMRRLLFFSAFTKEKKSTPRYIRVSNNYRHIPAHFNKETHGKPCIFCCACSKSDHAAQFIGNFTDHTQRISSRFSRKHIVTELSPCKPINNLRDLSFFLSKGRPKGFFDITKSNF